jgi:hypothetical protein
LAKLKRRQATFCSINDKKAAQSINVNQNVNNIILPSKGTWTAKSR